MPLRVTIFLLLFFSFSTIFLISFRGITFSVLFIGKAGLLAVVCGAVVGTFVTDIIGVQLAIRRKMNLSPFLFARKSLPRLLFLAGSNVMAYLAIRVTFQAETWHVLIAEGAMAGLTGSLLFVFVGMTRNERIEMIQVPFMKLVRLKMPR